MYYLPLLFICSLSMPTGDLDAGPNCIRYRDLTDAGYGSLTACRARLDEMVAEVKLEYRILWKNLPGPYRFKGNCTVPMVDEVVA